MTTALATATPDAPPELVARLEVAFRTLGKRVYLPSIRLLREHGVDKASYPLLALLGDHDAVRPSEAAALLELDLSTVSRQIKHLEDAGLLARTADTDDRRACRLSLTPLGQTRTAEVQALRSQLFDELMTGWSPEDRQTLLHLIDRLARTPAVQETS